MMYELFRDFASPIATIIAASVAGWVTYTFAKRQAGIAASQRDIALDKLKFDLFEVRYEIYGATKSLIEYVCFAPDLEKTDTTKINSLFVKLDEARFYFPPNICGILGEVSQICEQFFERLGERQRINPDNSEEWARSADALATEQRKLRSIYASLPKIFESSLAFKQLTTPLEPPILAYRTCLT